MNTEIQLPTFIIGGAPRSGTTYLTEGLDRHPEVFMAHPFIPEPKVCMGASQPRETYLERYRSLFGDCSEKTARGEKTSYYLECPAACERIHDLVPDVRILFIVREPVARAYSNYLKSKKGGLETLSFEQAISMEGKRSNPLSPDKSYAKPFDYLTRGNYAALAEPYLRAFGAQQVRFVLYEDITLRPKQLWKDIQAFLNLTQVAYSQLDVGIVNSAKEIGPPIDPEFEQQLRKQMSPHVRQFANLTGLDLEPWGYRT